MERAKVVKRVTMPYFIDRLMRNGDFSSKAHARRCLQAVMATLHGVLQEKRTVQFTGFGTFGVRERKAYTGRNPLTGKPIEVPARSVPYFKSSKNWQG